MYIQPSPVNATCTGSVHRHHVAIGQRSLDLSRMATPMLLSKASVLPGQIAKQDHGTLSSRAYSPRRPFRSWLRALVTSQSAKRVATALPRKLLPESPLSSLSEPSLGSPPRLSPEFYLGHTPSPLVSRHSCRLAGTTPRTRGPSPISDRRRIDSQVARRFSRQVVRVCLRLSPRAAFALVPCGDARFLRVERGSTRLPVPYDSSLFGYPL
jgi:hypothetical protein